jgi:biopolymer transport protein ExbB
MRWTDSFGEYMTAKLLRTFILYVCCITALVPASMLLTTGAKAQSAQSIAASTPTLSTPITVQTASAATKTDNPYGLGALWEGSDFVAKSVLVIMFVMSMGSWYIIITKIIEQAKMNKQAKDATDNFWKTGSIDQGAQALAEGSPYRFIANAGLDATKKHDGLLGQVDFNTWVTMSIQRAMERVQSRMQDGLAFLATVGSTAPFVGLFGTVWGIYHALTAIGVAGQASIDKVAGPVGEALIMTAIGLAVAVPAVLGYNWLVRRNKGVMDEVRSFGNDLHAVLLAQAAKKS